MKKALLTFILSLIASAFYAQELKLSYSHLTPNSIWARVMDAGKIGKCIYQIQSNGKFSSDMSLYVYDVSSMRLLKQSNFKQNKCEQNDCIDKHFDYVKTFFFKEAIFMFFETFDKSSDYRLLFVQKLNLNGDFVGKLIEIDKIDVRKRSEGSFMVWPSEDSSKFMVINNPPFEKYNNEKFGFKIYNNELKNLYNLSISLPYKDKNLAVNDYYLGNNGKIYLLTKIYLEKEQKERGQAPYFYSILTVNPTDNSVAEYKINLPSKNVVDIVLRLDKECKTITCAGFYSDLKPRQYEGKDIDGFFYLSIDAATQEIKTKGFKQIDKAMVAELINKKNVKEGKGIDKTFDIRYLFKRSDGTTTLLAENRYVEVITTTTCRQNGGCTHSTTYHYYRNNIFVINIGVDGSVLSFIDVPKKQHTINDGGLYSSFIPFEKDNRLFLIYNDNPKNLDPSIRTIDDTYSMPGMKKACLVAVEINKDGSYTKRKIQDNAVKKIVVLPEQGIKLGNGQYIAPIMEPLGACTCGCLLPFIKIKTGITKIEL